MLSLVMAIWRRDSSWLRKSSTLCAGCVLHSLHEGAEALPQNCSPFLVSGFPRLLYSLICGLFVLNVETPSWKHFRADRHPQSSLFFGGVFTLFSILSRLVKLLLNRLSSSRVSFNFLLVKLSEVAGTTKIQQQTALYIYPWGHRKTTRRAGKL